MSGGVGNMVPLRTTDTVIADDVTAGDDIILRDEDKKSP
jgi:hypothetical protein